MELINQHVKRIMEGCKERARLAGLSFQDETLEYIVTNRDLLELSPKVMIPTLYDYWVHDVEVLKEKGKYELYPHNPYETVINTRPPISFYNDNNPDWLNVMIFYHVLAHIDFFQNNLFFRHTWEYDFTAQALSDKRLIARLRGEKGRWLDYVIEFARGIDNLVGYHDELADLHTPRPDWSPRLDFYFDVFLQNVKKVSVSEYVREVERYNESVRRLGARGEQTFFLDTAVKYPEFEALFTKQGKRRATPRRDILQFLMDHSPALNRGENRWMKSVLEVVRKTAIFFQPQIRTKIMNEGWASYWHDTLFLQDDRIRGHEADYARVNAGVTAMPRVGLNPYALGMRLLSHMEEEADKGRYTFDFQRLLDARDRREFDARTGTGKDFISQVRENLCDFTFINTYLDQDFVNRHRLFVVGRRLNEQRQVWEYYVKSRKAEDYRNMVLGSLYHPPFIEIDPDKGEGTTLYLVHHFEEKPLVKEFIAETMMGIEFLWGGPVQLETSEVVSVLQPPPAGARAEAPEPQVTWRRIVYTMENRQLSQRPLE
jgi:stage V sporulation protein R